MKKFILLIATVCIFMTHSAQAKEWYEGGTLHQAPVSEWLKAPPANMLATTADFISSTTSEANMQTLTMDGFKKASDDVTMCMLTTTETVPSTHNLKGSEIAILCMTQLKPNFPWFLSGNKKIKTSETHNIQITENITSKQNQTDKPSTLEVNKEMPWTFSQIIRSYNKLAPSMNLPKANHVSTGKELTKNINYKLTPFTNVVFTCNKDGEKPTSIFFVGTSDGSDVSGASITLSGMLIIAAITPNYSGDERRQILENLGLLSGNISDGTKRTVSTNDIEISSSYSDLIGFTLTISPIQ